MSFKVSSEDFQTTLLRLTEGLQGKEVIKKDLTTHKKGGVMWATLSIFCKIFCIDINRSYRPKVVVPNLVEFCFQNREHINNEGTKNAVMGMLEALKTALRKNKKNGIYDTAIDSQMEIARFRALISQNAQMGEELAVRQPPARDAQGIPVPPPLPAKLPISDWKKNAPATSQQKQEVETPKSDPKPPTNPPLGFTFGAAINGGIADARKNLRSVQKDNLLSPLGVVQKKQIEAYNATLTGDEQILVKGNSSQETGEPTYAELVEQEKKMEKDRVARNARRNATPTGDEPVEGKLASQPTGLNLQGQTEDELTELAQCEKERLAFTANSQPNSTKS